MNSEGRNEGVGCALAKSEQGLDEQLLAEGAAFNDMLANETTQTLMGQFMDAGGQTPETERNLGEFAANFAKP